MGSAEKYDLYYDGTLVARVDSVNASFPSLHTKVDLSVNEATGELREKLDRYIGKSREHHALTLEGKHKEADRLYVDDPEAYSALGEHLWVIRSLREGVMVNTKIRPPYFGSKDYLRITYYPSRPLEYDHEKLAALLWERLEKIEAAIEKGADRLSPDALAAHRNCLAQMLTLHKGYSGRPNDKSAASLLAWWFGKVKELDSPFPEFGDPFDAGRIDQACALEK